jgi:hypothetical protein
VLLVCIGYMVLTWLDIGRLGALEERIRNCGVRCVLFRILALINVWDRVNLLAYNCLGYKVYGFVVSSDFQAFEVLMFACG